jgi:hypothetical protein
MLAYYNGTCDWVRRGGCKVEEKRLIQLISEKRHSMHTLYVQANKNLRDEKVLAASKEVDYLVNAVMKQRMAMRKKVHC